MDDSQWPERKCAECGEVERAPFPAPDGWTCWDCGEKRRVELNEHLEAQRRHELARMVTDTELAKIPAGLAHCTREAWDQRRGGPWPPAAERFVEAVASGSRGVWALVILSETTGNGKTHVATSVYRELIGRMQNPRGSLWITAAGAHRRLLAEQDARRRAEDASRHRPNQEAGFPDRDIRVELVEAPLLLLDDFGQERNTPGAKALISESLIERHNLWAPTILTGNIGSIADIAKNYDERLSSRLHLGVELVMMSGADQRRRRPQGGG